ncbi:Strictosidine synthase [Bertholletia excelsa]
MSQPTPPGSSSTRLSNSAAKPNRSIQRYAFLLSVMAPVVAAVAAVLIYHLDSFDPAHLPTQVFTRSPVTVPRENPRILDGAEKVGVGRLLGPEDIAYDPNSGVVYTGCGDGWIKRFAVTDSAADLVPEDVVNSGGRPLGLILGRNNEVIVADADRGLLNVTKDGGMELLTKEADGLEFRLTDGVDVAEDGVIYFTDASHKYMLKNFIWDILEGRPHGRLLSYDPSTKQTKVLLSGLYFPNGVAISPDQQFVIFCETPLRSCKKYYIQGERKGLVDIFIDGLPGMPDNIHYQSDDGEGYYWIAIATAATYSWDLAQRYPSMRKVIAILERYVGRPYMERDGGFLAVDLEGNPAAYYHDPRISLVCGAYKIGDYLYGGSIVYPYIVRFNLTHHPAQPVAKI